MNAKNRIVAANITIVAAHPSNDAFRDNASRPMARGFRTISIITSINGIATTDADRIAPMMRGLKVGASLKMTLFRDGETREVAYTLPERPLLPGDLPEEQAGLQEPTLSPRREKP